jgi:butyryl-CoA dehydrogenase
MFHMMNEARVSVGLGATMLGYTAYLHALEYARGRPQGRPIGPAGKDATQPQVPIIRHADVKRMLLAQKSYAEGALALNLYCARLLDDQQTAETPQQREDATLLLEILTPIAKSWPSQWCLEGNALAIQVHGGYGYTRDYMVEQFYRDNRLNAIHEGTHGIQALDLLGRKVVMQQGAAFKLLAKRIEETVDRARQARHPDTQRWASMLADRVRLVATVTQRVWAADDAERSLANATAYLEAFGHVVLAWLWLEQSLAATRNYRADDGDFYHGKWQACRYFFLYELPKVDAWLELAGSLDTTTVDMQDAWF